MRDRLMLELIAEVVKENREGKSIASLKDRFSKVLDKYDIKEMSTDLIVYDPFPKEAKMYLVSRSVEGLAKGSADNYFTILKMFFSMIRVPLNKVDTNTFRLWLYQMKTQRGVSDRTLEGYRTVVNTFFEWCVTNGYLERNPGRGVPAIRYVETKRCYLTQKELEEIRNHVKCLRDRVIIEVYYSTGMRCSEITTLLMGDLDLQNKRIKVYNKKGKRYKTCYLNDKAVYYLEKYIPTRKGKNDFIIQGEREPHGQMTKAGMEAVIRRIMKECAIDKHVTPSTFRHTMATQALNGGMDLSDVQLLLDHKNPATTLVYAEKYRDDLQASHRKTII